MDIQYRIVVIAIVVVSSSSTVSNQVLIGVGCVGICFARKRYKTWSFGFVVHSVVVVVDHLGGLGDQPRMRPFGPIFAKFIVFQNNQRLVVLCQRFCPSVVFRFGSMVPIVGRDASQESRYERKKARDYTYRGTILEGSARRHDERRRRRQSCFQEEEEEKQRRPALQRYSATNFLVITSSDWTLNDLACMDTEMRFKNFLRKKHLCQNSGTIFLCRNIFGKLSL
mmetsp:Transcript_2015/g.3690  ORF Transcript_2015/g.3690 Transcript_2015/m.3690 type:complete len:225 (+) Transcript_2015:905-1579(+)